MSILVLENITKQFAKTKANDHISFEVPEGSIFGLLGPNGAGKTTLIRIITQILVADSGTILFDGAHLKREHSSQIGYMPEERGLYKKMGVGEHLVYLARLKDMSKQEATAKIREWLVKFEIENWWGKKVEELSKGMQQKIQFISTVIHQPKILILDEPFSGLDPINTNLIKEEINTLRENGTTIIFSTHRMEQVEEICEQIVLVNAGKIILEGGVLELKHRFKEHRFKVHFGGELGPAFNDLFQVIDRKDHEVTVQIDPEKKSNEVIKYFVDQQLEVHSYQEILPSLNEIFIKQVGESNE